MKYFQPKTKVDVGFLNGLCVCRKGGGGDPAAGGPGAGGLHHPCGLEDGGACDQEHEVRDRRVLPRQVHRPPHWDLEPGGVRTGTVQYIDQIVLIDMCSEEGEIL